ncbi:hypothetical protein DFH07DRAFT_952295 [Mycena maculata]|uniref:Uncharacterized protein n=1 Tax=Mycena maculata TaxID=230809 RepID=A0AAD7JYF4_9AGAR|nr:hypothetical protein DFH07DRAFT_952295 [Mycena maculata]
MSLSWLISFPDDFDPPQPALAPNAPIPDTLASPSPFLPLPALDGADDNLAPSTTTSSASSVETVFSAFDPMESGAGGPGPAPGIDPIALVLGGGPTSSMSSIPIPTSSNNRSLVRQTSTSFRAAAASANSAAASANLNGRVAPAAQSTAASALANGYFQYGMNPTPSGIETAAAARTRYNDNQDTVVNIFQRFDQEAQSQARITRERHEEVNLMINQAQITASEETRKLWDVQVADYSALSQLVNAVNGLRRDVTVLRSRPTTRANPVLGPLPVLVDATTPSAPSSRSTGVMGPPPSEASSLGTHHECPLFDDNAPPAKRQHTNAPQDRDPFDVWFYDVATSGEPRDIARAAMQAIPHLTGGSFLNAIRVRSKSATISIHFHSLPFALTFIDAIENCPPPNFEGLHVCWAPASADPISIIRGEGYIGRSTG